jgi:hypothetical protein
MPQNKANGLEALTLVYSWGCCLAEEQLRAIEVAENTDLNIRDIVRQPSPISSLHFAVSHGQQLL